VLLVRAGGSVRMLALYTDGLVERRYEPIDTGLARLATALGTAPQAPDACLDHLLAELLPEAPDDDVALVAVQR
jgi:Stage II sporulation protein E (SpoIIE)